MGSMYVTLQTFFHDLKPTMFKRLLLLFCFLASNTYAQSISSVFLLYPQNEQVLQEKNPKFSWTPETGTNISYALRVVEILDNQTPEAAFQANQSYFYQENISSNVLAYPMGGSTFQDGKRYAWAVSTAKHVKMQNSQVFKSSVGGTATHKVENTWSEVYVFELKEDKKQSTCAINANHTQDETFSRTENQRLEFYFSEESGIEGNHCKYRFLMESKEDITNITRNVVPTRIGRNYELLLRQYSFFREKTNYGRIFFLEITTKDGNKKYIKFINS
jgi:hypothetical protein